MFKSKNLPYQSSTSFELQKLQQRLTLKSRLPGYSMLPLKQWGKDYLYPKDCHYECACSYRKDIALIQARSNRLLRGAGTSSPRRSKSPDSTVARFINQVEELLRRSQQTSPGKAKRQLLKSHSPAQRRHEEDALKVPGKHGLGSMQDYDDLRRGQNYDPKRELNFDAKRREFQSWHAHGLEGGVGRGGSEAKGGTGQERGQQDYDSKLQNDYEPKSMRQESKHGRQSSYGDYKALVHGTQAGEGKEFDFKRQSEDKYYGGKRSKEDSKGEHDYGSTARRQYQDPKDRRVEGKLGRSYDDGQRAGGSGKNNPYYQDSRGMDYDSRRGLEQDSRRGLDYDGKRGLDYQRKRGKAYDRKGLDYDSKQCSDNGRDRETGYSSKRENESDKRGFDSKRENGYDKRGQGYDKQQGHGERQDYEKRGPDFEKRQDYGKRQDKRQDFEKKGFENESRRGSGPGKRVEKSKKNRHEQDDKHREDYDGRHRQDYDGQQRHDFDSEQRDYGSKPGQRERRGNNHYTFKLENQFTHRKEQEGQPGTFANSRGHVFETEEDNPDLLDIYQYGKQSIDIKESKLFQEAQLRRQKAGKAEESSGKEAMLRESQLTKELEREAQHFKEYDVVKQSPTPQQLINIEAFLKEPKERKSSAGKRGESKGKAEPGKRSIFSDHVRFGELHQSSIMRQDELVLYEKEAGNKKDSRNEDSLEAVNYLLSRERDLSKSHRTSVEERRRSLEKDSSRLGERRSRRIDERNDSNEGSMVSRIENELAQGKPDSRLLMIQKCYENSIQKDEKKIHEVLVELHSALRGLSSGDARFKLYEEVVFLALQKKTFEIVDFSYDMVDQLIHRLRDQEDIAGHLRALSAAVQDDLYEAEDLLCTIRRERPDLREPIVITELFVILENVQHPSFYEFLASMVAGVIRLELGEARFSAELQGLERQVTSLKGRSSRGVEFSLEQLYSKEPRPLLSKSRLYYKPRKQERRPLTLTSYLSNIDDVFKPNAFSVLSRPQQSKNARLKAVRWCHVYQKFPHSEVGACSGRLRTGLLNAQYLYRSFEVLMEKYSSCLQQMVTENDNFFEVRLFHNGEGKVLKVDGFIPVDDKDEPAFVQPLLERGKVFIWPLLLEKALAKMYGTYESLELEGSEFADSLKDLTGQPSLELRLTQEQLFAQLLPQLLAEACSTFFRKGSRFVELLRFNSASKVFGFREPDLEGFRKDVILPQESGVSEIRLKHIDKVFDSAVCFYRYPFQTTVKVFDCECEMALKQFWVERNDSLMIDLTQVDLRFATRNKNKYAVIRLVVLRSEDNRTTIVDAAFGERKTIGVKTQLPAGRYFVYVDSKWPGKKGDLVLNIYSNQHRVEVTNEPAETINRLFASVAESVAVPGQLSLTRSISQRGGLVFERVVNSTGRPTRVFRSAKKLLESGFEVLFSEGSDIDELLSEGEELVIVLRGRGAECEQSLGRLGLEDGGQSSTRLLDEPNQLVLFPG